MKQFKLILFILSYFSLVFPIKSGILTYLPGAESQPYLPQSGIYSQHELQTIIPLSGTWNLILSDGSSRQVRVPGCWAYGEGDATLQTNFKIPSSLKGRHFRLAFWGAKQQLEVRVNDRLLEAYEGDWTTLILDLPEDLLRYDKPNELIVNVGNRLSPRSTIPIKPKLYQNLPYAGLYADAALIAGPSTTLESLRWSVTLDKNREFADWTIHLEFRNQGQVKRDSTFQKTLRLQATWVSPDGLSSGSSEVVNLNLGPVETAPAELWGRISNPRLWSLAKPLRYRFSIRIQEGNLSWTIPFLPGVMESAWRPDGIIINGDLQPIRGIDLRQENADHGIALSIQEIEDDLQKIKRMGFNLVRIIGSPPHPVTAEICSRIGLLLIPETGLNGIPTSIFLSPLLQSHLEQTVRELIQRDSSFPCIAGWQIASGLELDTSITHQLERLAEKSSAMDSRPLIVGFASTETIELPSGIIGITQRPPYQLYEPISIIYPKTSSWLYSGIGTFAVRFSRYEEKSVGAVRQSNSILRQMNMLHESSGAGYLLDGFADRRVYFPLMIMGSSGEEMVVTRGLFALDRRERIASQKVADALGQLKIDAPVIRVEAKELPVTFPLATIVVIAILLLVRKQNNIFKQNLNRVFAHTYGFFDDIRRSRYTQISQPTLVALLTSATMGILFEGWLFHCRTDFALDYLLSLALPWITIKRHLVILAWNPIIAIPVFLGISFIFYFLLTILLQLLSITKKGKMKLRQAYSMVCWGSAHYLLLTPLGLVQFRLLEFGWFRTLMFILIVVFYMWYLQRLSSIIRIGMRVNPRLAWGIILIVIFVLLVTVLSIYENQNAFFEYLDYYSNVILPWIKA